MLDQTEEHNLLPFLRWAGGKRWLINSGVNFYPKEYQTYIEPFLGGGAVFFFLNPKRAILSDINENLVQTFQAIKDDWKTVFDGISKYQKKHSKEFYYQERDKKRLLPHDKASQLIYLNRTCWNGLYRVNSDGLFNVPKGTKDTVVFENDNFEAISKRLLNAELICSDFERTIAKAKKGDFVFADPPYTVKHNENGFLHYNEKIFSWDDQERLHKSLKEADERGVNFTLTNANHCSIRDLYKDFDQHTLQRNSILAAIPSNRKKIEELLVTNWRR